MNKQLFSLNKVLISARVTFKPSGSISSQSPLVECSRYGDGLSPLLFIPRKSSLELLMRRSSALCRWRAIWLNYLVVQFSHNYWQPELLSTDFRKWSNKEQQLSRSSSDGLACSHTFRDNQGMQKQCRI
ncbi:hypothetical protein CDAR_445071 [Caerostris darwini]|uniref:Uncharacterized protein n=1 Tax=Caerostris darwini TaxID=1538125 RepID=A0AAV4MSF6_9ARAC|nr:hypothetical protein CDAR_445071 [Caerostris darwini]